MSINQIPATALTAEYSSPSKTQFFSAPLPSADNSSTMAKTAYMTTLRTEVSNLQDSINAYLTERMEEDKAAVAASDGVNAKKGKKIDEDREEEMYGEEGEDEDT